MSDQLDKKSILEMSMGAILERVDYEMGKVMDNILDPNTKATAKRKISVTLELIPSADRRTITVQSTAKASITAYFEDKLAEEVKDGKIVVMM